MKLLPPQIEDAVPSRSCLASLRRRASPRPGWRPRDGTGAELGGGGAGGGSVRSV